MVAMCAALLMGACDAATDTTTTSTSTTTTFAPIEIVEVSTTLPPGVDPAVYEQLRPQLEALADAVQDLRGLRFLQVPDIVVLAADDFLSRLEAAVAPRLDAEALAIEEETYRLLGQYDEPPSIARAIRQVFVPPQAVAFYDGERAQVVVDGTRAELSALDASIVVRALAWALIDQYHDAYDRIAALDATGDLDALDALSALAEGDAIATQLRYLQSLDDGAQADAAAEAASRDQPGLEQLPDVVREQLSLPAEHGVAFVEEIVSGGGYAALDRAYDDPPASTEQLLHPERFAIDETIRGVPELKIEVDGYELVASGSYGEWRLRQLLRGAVEPGLLTQTAAGWGGDGYHLLVNGDDLLFVYIYGGDTQDDAIEVAQALLALARGPMQAGDGVDSGGGVLWEGAGRYVFVDRIGDGLAFIASTSLNAGATARRQIRVP